jgi:two-component system cell cycle sensor histidine kinase/response regulator CckA
MSNWKAQLRERAVNRVERRSTRSSGIVSRASMAEVELEVSSVELELQNEQLRAVEAELVASRDRYRSLFERAPFACVEVDAGGLIQEANAEAEKLLGEPRARLCATPLSRFVSHGQAVEYELHRRTIASDMPAQTEVNLSGRNGFRIVRLVSVPHADGSGAWQCVLYDRTTEIARESELEEARRLKESAFARSGLAHDFNNLLIGIHLHAESALELAAHSDAVRVPLHRLQLAVVNAATLVRELLEERRSSPPSERPSSGECATPPLLAASAGAGIESGSRLTRRRREDHG